MKELQRTLSEIFAPSGREGVLAEFLREKVTPFADKVWTDALGNLIVFKKGSDSAKKLMLAAHMDSVGIAVTLIDENGYLRFGTVGGINPTVLLGQTVVFANGVKGVVMADGDIKAEDLTAAKMYVDIGVYNKNDAEKLTKISDFGVFSTQSFQNGETLFSTFLDDRIGCAILIKLLEETKPNCDLYVAFTAQEELGARGAATAAYAIEPDLCIAVDVTYTGDTPKPDQKIGTKLGGGPVITVKDGKLIAHPDAVAALENAALAANIAVQREAVSSGGTDAGSAHLTRGGVPSACLCVPTRYMHSPVAAANVRDIGGTLEILKVLVRGKSL